MRRLGATLDLPFEKQPLTAVDLDHAHMSGGLVVIAAMIPVPDMGPKPALVYRFATPEGEFYPPMVLVVDEDQMTKLAQLTASATAAAISASRGAGDTP
jgi:hypothetical protein